MSEAIGNVVSAAVTELIEDGIALGNEYMRCIAGMGLVGIVARGSVAHIVNSDFDGPVAAAAARDRLHRLPCAAAW